MCIGASHLARHTRWSTGLCGATTTRARMSGTNVLARRRLTAYSFASSNITPSPPSTPISRVAPVNDVFHLPFRTRHQGRIATSAPSRPSRFVNDRHSGQSEPGKAGCVLECSPRVRLRRNALAITSRLREAQVRPMTRRLLARVAEKYPCIVISGRAHPDLAKRASGWALPWSLCYRPMTSATAAA